MEKPISLVTATASPLITPTKADALDTLIKMKGLRVIIPDLVRLGVIQNAPPAIAPKIDNLNPHSPSDLLILLSRPSYSAYKS